MSNYAPEPQMLGFDYPALCELNKWLKNFGLNGQPTAEKIRDIFQRFDPLGDVERAELVKLRGFYRELVRERAGFAVAEGSAFHVDHGPLRRSFTRDELFKFAEKWMRANSLEIGCSRDYYHEWLGLLISFTGDLFDGSNNPGQTPEGRSPGGCL